MKNTPIIIADGDGTHTNVIGNAITIKIHGRDTGGAFSLIESVDKADEGPPPHIHHREDETFYVLEGDYEFSCGGQKHKASKGDTVFAPRDVPHNYKCVSKTGGRMLVVISPAGFEGFFEEVSGMTDVGRVVEIANRYGAEFV